MNPDVPDFDVQEQARNEKILRRLRRAWVDTHSKAEREMLVRVAVEELVGTSPTLTRESFIETMRKLRGAERKIEHELVLIDPLDLAWFGDSPVQALMHLRDLAKLAIPIPPEGLSPELPPTTLNRAQRRAARKAEARARRK